MAANDYLMRQIEDMARFLGKVLFVKTEETIPLFDEQGNVLESGLLYKPICSIGRTRRWKRLIFPVRRFWTALQP